MRGRGTRTPSMVMRRGVCSARRLRALLQRVFSACIQLLNFSNEALIHEVMRFCDVHVLAS